jgi:hypothetical protein
VDHKASALSASNSLAQGQANFKLSADGTELSYKLIAAKIDNASRHLRAAVNPWLRANNQWVKRQGARVRLIVCLLPTKSPLLNPIESTWMHDKHRVVEPERVLPTQQRAEHVCQAFGCAHEDHLTIPDYVS